MIGIYRIVNSINGKCYVGQSMNVERRIREHKFTSSSPGLREDIQLFGFDNFYGEVLEECNAEDLNDLEIYYISKFNSTDPDFGYNIHPGGRHKAGYVVSEKTRKLLSCRRKDLASRSGFKNSTAGSKIVHKGDVQSRASGATLDYMLKNGWELGASESFKKHLSEINSGENNYCYGKGYMFEGEKNHFYGKHHTEETKQKIRDHMPDTSYNWRGKHHTEESKAKMRGPRPASSGVNNHNYGKRGKDSYLWGYRAVHKDGVGKRVKPEELQSYLDNGWKLGNRPDLMTDEKRKMYGESTKGRKLMNKDGVNKYIKSSEFSMYLDNGWVFGRSKSQKGE